MARNFEPRQTKFYGARKVAPKPSAPIVSAKPEAIPPRHKAACELEPDFMGLAEPDDTEDYSEVVGEGHDPIEPEWPSTAAALDSHRRAQAARRTIWDNPEVQRYYRWLDRHSYKYFLQAGQLVSASDQDKKKLRERKNVAEFFSRAAQPADTPRTLRKLTYDQPNPRQSEVRFTQIVCWIGIAGMLLSLLVIFYYCFDVTDELFRWLFAHLFNERWPVGSNLTLIASGVGAFILFGWLAASSDEDLSKLVKAWDGLPLFGNSMYAYYNDDLTLREEGFDPLGLWTVKGPLADYHGRSPFGDAGTASTEQAQRGMKGQRYDPGPKVRN